VSAVYGQSRPTARGKLYTAYSQYQLRELFIPRRHENFFDNGRILDRRCLLIQQ
jgi:hypothetical protein